MQIARTSLLGFALLAGSASLAAATPVTAETVVHNRSTRVQIALDDKSVLCSAADYGATYLKIGMPELARLTLLDHQNTGAGAPCVQAGPCQPGNMPSDIIDDSRPTEDVWINVKEVRVDVSDADTQTCNTSLTERVRVNVRGKVFTHERFLDLVPRQYADCAQPSATGKADDDAPDAGADSATAAPNAGCSAGGTGTGTGAAAFLAAIAVVWRRRRARS